MVLAHNVSEGFRTRDIQITQDVTFQSMLLSSKTLEGLQESGFYKPSPVQLHGIPFGKCGFDLLLEAKSGTGKTAVFSVIALEKLDLNKGLQVVILAPTREIASQICDVIRQIGLKYEGLNVEVVMGGLPVEDDVNKFKKNVHIVVGSPGRLRHLVQDKYIVVSSVRLLVLDEADKLMDKSFLPDINFIFSLLPNQKQVILSSATYTESTKSFIKKYVKTAQHICPDSNCVLLGVDQKTTLVKFNANIVRQTQNRFEELLQILSKKIFKQCLIFCNYQARVTELHRLLMKHKWPVEQLYGQQDQTDRLGALKTLQDYKCRILIATDLAARGIDASNVDLVINFEPPFEWQTYLHRIGRAGRFGSYGMSITILSEGKEEKKFSEILDLLKIPSNKFWTNEKNMFKTPQQQEPDNTTIKNNLEKKDENCSKYQELWKLLIGEKHEGDNIENFETLCNSFDEAKTVVESFDDLLNSFKSELKLKPDVVDEYPYLQITSQFLEYCSDSLKALKNFENELKFDVNKKYNNIEKKKEKDMNPNNNCSKESSSNSIQKNTTDNKTTKPEKEAHIFIKSSPPLDKLPDEYTEIKDTEKIPSITARLEASLPNSITNISILNNTTRNKTTKSNKNIKSGPPPDKELNEYTDEMPSITTLLEAGLPVSFGTYRDKKKHISSKNMTKEKYDQMPALDTEQNHYIDFSNTKSNNTRNRVPYEARNKRNQYKHSQSSSRKEYENMRSCYDYVESSDSDDSDYGLNESYVNWYNQLKLRMKQIELALYVEEMSLM